MRESVFSFPTQGRACVCISSALYDRRAIDAPSPSLPLINSLTHLSYLTATSPRIREILSLDGGLERLVKILKICASGGPILLEENLAQMKGKGSSLAPGARRNPFRPFSEFSQTKEEESQTRKSGEKLLIYTYTLAFQCVVNIGVRGSEMIRTRVVEAGALDVVVHVLEGYLVEIEKRKTKAESDYKSRTLGHRMEALGTVMPSRPILSQLEISTLDIIEITQPPTRVSTPVSSVDEGSAADESASSSGQELDGEVEEESSSSRTRRARAATIGKIVDGAIVDSTEGDGDGDITMEAPSATPRAIPRSIEDFNTTVPPSTLEPGLQYRDEDVLLSLQLLAYLSKYPHVRSVFHSPADECDGHEEQEIEEHDHSECANECTLESLPRRAASTSTPPQLDEYSSLTPTLSSNIFSLVESFTHRPPSSDRFTPRHSNEVQYWAGVIMRNACRKDESRGGIRQCANMLCGIWEKFPREFAKCRRCRKAKYCSKGCQSKAWQFGHRYWCAKAAPKELEEDVGGNGILESRSSSVATPSASTRQPRLARPNHHLSVSRPNTATSIDTEEEDELRLPPPNLVARARNRNSIINLTRGLEPFNNGGGGDEIGEIMNEFQVAEEMLVGGGRVFGTAVSVIED